MLPKSVAPLLSFGAVLVGLMFVVSALRPAAGRLKALGVGLALVALGAGSFYATVLYGDTGSGPSVGQSRPSAGLSVASSDRRVSQTWWYCWDVAPARPHHFGYHVVGDHFCTDGELEASGCEVDERFGLWACVPPLSPLS
jgi:hypothetical protein